MMSYSAILSNLMVVMVGQFLPQFAFRSYQDRSNCLCIWGSQPVIINDSRNLTVFPPRKSQPHMHLKHALSIIFHCCACS